MGLLGEAPKIQLQGRGAEVTALGRCTAHAVATLPQVTRMLLGRDVSEPVAPVRHLAEAAFTVGAKV